MTTPCRAHGRRPCAHHHSMGWCGLLVLTVLTLGLWSPTAWAAFTASTDRTQLAPGESVQLTLQSDRSGNSQPQLAPLDKDFEVLGRSTSTSVQFVNGSMSSLRQVRLVLAPRHSGRVEVPALQWDGENSSAIELNVTTPGASASTHGTAASGSAEGATGAAAHVFLTTSLDALQPHVQSALALTVRLYSDQKLYQATLDLPGNADVRVQRIGSDATVQETRNGRTYQVTSRHYLLVPQRSGELQLDGPVLNAQVADINKHFDPFIERLFGQLQIEGGVSGTRPLRLRGDAIKLAVQPRPPAWRTADWLPAQQLTLDQAWRPADKVVAVGEPLTRQLRLAAVGQSASQLPDLAAHLAMPEGLQAHAEDPRLTEELRDGHIVALREQDLTLLADRPGRYQLPEVRLPWWDVVHHQRREAVLPALTVDVVAAANTASNTTPANASPAPTTAAPTPASASLSPPQPAASAPAGPASTEGSTGADRGWLSAVFALLWLVTLGGWTWTHRRRHRTARPVAPAAPALAAVSAAAARQAFQRACAGSAAPPARDALIAWARATWPHDAPPGLNALARRLGHPALTALLRDLDRACITSTAWNGEALARALPDLQAALSPASKTPAPAASALPGLYSDPPH